MRFASVSEAAHVLSVSAATIRHWCYQGKIESFRVGDFLHVNLWKFLTDNKIDPKPIFESLDERKATIPSVRKRTYAKKAGRISETA